MKNVLLTLVALLFLSGCVAGIKPASVSTINLKYMIKLTSPQFEPGDVLPSEFTCDGRGISPELHIADVPAEAKSLALMLDDPDALSGTFTHWIVYGLDPGLTVIKEDDLPAEAVIGINSGGRQSYFPPCPPSGSHRYVFHVYALDKKINFVSAPDRRQIDEAINSTLIDS